MIETIISTVKPILEPIAASIVANHFDDWKDKKQLLQIAINNAFEHWIITILHILQAQGYEDSDLRQFFLNYKEDIEIFLKDSEVVNELLKPFSATTTKYKINHKLLMQRWAALKLRELPEEFDAASVSRGYLRRVKNAGIVTDELRPLFSAQLAQDRTDYLESIRGVWPDFELDNYAERVKTRYKVLDLSALTPPSRDDVDDASILLKDVFVPQMVRQDRPPRELPKEISNKLHEKGELNLDEFPDDFDAKDFKDLQHRWTQSKPESVLTVVAKPENKHLILLGDPGSGKSTLARYLLLSVLDETSEVFKTDIFSGHLPLLVELRNYMGEVAANNCDGFLEYFHYLGKTQGYTINHLELKEQLETRPCLIIFDGLDEIFDPVWRDKITQEIIGFAGEYPQTRVVVTSRIIGYQGKALKAADFCEYTLLDLDEEQIKTFAQGWFNLVFKDKPEEANSRYKRIETALQNSPAIRQLAGNPLLLTMIAIIAKHQELPRERSKLYEHATKVLCHHWDVTGHKIPLEETPTDFMREDDKLELLRQIAWRMQASAKGLAGNFILRDDLEDEIASYLRTRWQLSEREIGQISHAMIEQLRERNFILCLYGPQVYGFVHRTFLEYFCAAEIVYRFEKQQTLSFDELKTDIFLAHFRDETWHEVLRLICGMIESKFTGQLVEFIISEAEKQQDYKNQFKELVFAQTCLNEAKIKPVEKIKTAEIIKHLYLKFQFFAKNEFVFPYADDEDDFPDDQNDFHDDEDGFDYDSSVSVDAIKCLLEHYPQYHTETYSFIQQVIQNDRFGEVSYTAVGLLAKHYQSNPKTYSLLQQFVKENGRPESYAAIHSLTEYYKDHPDTYPLLKKIIQDDDFMYHDLKNTAVESLAKHYQDRPETYSLLQEIVPKVWNKKDSYKISFHEDKKSYCTAIKSLAEYYQDRPETYPLLQKLVKEDMDTNIRSTAVESLAKHYHNNQDTYSLLQQVIQNDEHEDVRRVAVKSLVEQYKDHPEVLPMLKKIIINDEEASIVRSAAVGGLAKLSYDGTWQKLLFKNLIRIFLHDNWLDSKAIIDEKRVEEAAKALELPPETIRQHYEDIAKEIPLQLSWKAD
jgi:energy-coupling factor transporter ATP-binding protein EcfA2